MHLRARYNGLTIFWVVLSVFQIALILERIHRHAFRTGSAWSWMDAVSLTLYALCVAFYLIGPLFDFWKVDPAGVLYRKFWITRAIPFTQIAAIRPLGEHTVEIEVARRGKDIYPHQYLIAAPVDPATFLQSVATHAPQVLA